MNKNNKILKIILDKMIHCLMFIVHILQIKNETRTSNFNMRHVGDVNMDVRNSKTAHN